MGLFVSQHNRDYCRAATSFWAWQLRVLAFVAAATLILSLATTTYAAGQKKRSQSIVVLVNDEPITSYEVRQRQNLLGLGNKKIASIAQKNFQRVLKQKKTSAQLKAILKKVIDANRGKSREEIIAIFEKRKKAFGRQLQKRAVASARKSVLSGLKDKALNELIDERLQLQEAKRLNVLANDAEVNKMIVQIAQRNKQDLKGFAANLKKIGTDIHSMRDRFRAMLSWRNVVRRKFGQQLHLTSRDIDRWTDKTANNGPANQAASLKLQRITFALVGGAKEANFAQLLQQADTLRQRHKSCSDTPRLVQSVAGARFEDLGTRTAGSIAEPTRTMLLNAQPGEMLPASIGSAGVELWVLCEKKSPQDAGPSVGAGGRGQTAKEAARQREFKLLAKRHIKDLRQDAHIEYR